MIEALEGGDPALDAFEPVLDVTVDRHQAEGFVEGVAADVAEVLDLAVPVLGFDATHAAEEPIRVDEGLDDRELARTDGATGVDVLAGEGFELVRVVTVDEEGVGVQSGTSGVPG
jgi:hypothetical protein